MHKYLSNRTNEPKGILKPSSPARVVNNRLNWLTEDTLEIDRFFEINNNLGSWIKSNIRELKIYRTYLFNPSVTSFEQLATSLIDNSQFNFPSSFENFNLKRIENSELFSLYINNVTENSLTSFLYILKLYEMLDKIASIKLDSSDKKIKLSFRVFDECINLETLNIRRVNFYSLIHSFNELENKQILFSENHIDTVKYFVKGVDRYFTTDENGNSLNKITFLPEGTLTPSSSTNFETPEFFQQSISIIEDDDFLSSKDHKEDTICDVCTIC